MTRTLLELRTEAGKTRAEVAADLGIGEWRLQQLEALERLPHRWSLVFAVYFSVGVEELEERPRLRPVR